MVSSTPLLFILGTFSSLSPCFFPLFPSFLAYVANVEKNIRNGILAGFACLLGIALSFTVYGVFASFLFLPLVKYGTILRSIFGLIIIILGVAMYTQSLQISIRLPQKLFAFKGYLGAFILGLSYTLIAAPCATPIFLSAILLAITPGNTVLTIIKLLVFTLGVIFPFVFSALLVMATKDFLRNQYQSLAKWFNLLSSSILILTGLLFFLPIFGFPSIFF